MADSHILSMANIEGERFRLADYTVFYYEGCQMPPDFQDFGESGDIFAFRGIGGLEIDRRLYVKTYATKRSSSQWKEVKHEVRHQRKNTLSLQLCPGFPFWPIWYPTGCAYSNDRPLLNLGHSFDLFFRHHANRQLGLYPHEPIIIKDTDDEPIVIEDSDDEA